MNAHEQTMVWFLVEQDGAVLMALRKPELAPFGGQWTLPGDRLLEGESPSYGIARFARDELDIDVLGDQLLDTLTLMDGDTYRTASIYRVGFEGTPRFRESGPFVQVGWAYAHDLPQPMPPGLVDLLQRLALSRGE